MAGRRKNQASASVVRPDSVVSNVTPDGDDLANEGLGGLSMVNGSRLNTQDEDIDDGTDVDDLDPQLTPKLLNMMTKMLACQQKQK